MSLPVPRGVVFELEDLRDLINLAEHVKTDVPLPGDSEGKPLPLRVSVGDAIGDSYVAHIEIDPDKVTTVDFTQEARPT